MKSIIFDVDGTLLSTESMYITALSETLKDHGIERSEAELHHVFGLPGPESLEYLKIPNPEIIQADWVNRLDDFRDSIFLYPEVLKMLDQLQKEQNKMGIVTSNTPAEFAAHHDRFGIEKFFTDFVFAGMTQKMKPAGDPILLAMNNLDSIPAQTIYIGDSIHDMQAAHNAGIAYGMAAWGVKNRDVFGDQADYIFETPNELVEWSKQ